jgi:hypothetical protein
MDTPLIQSETETIFVFQNDPNKTRLLTEINEKLNINKNPTNKLVFVYSAPKVGSTSIVSSLRIFGTNKISVIHIHDEEMLRVVGRITGVTINEIILFNKYLGREVYVIDVYRSPIERKISAFFEKIGSYHFNTKDEEVNKYNVFKVINRFNNIFPHIANGDHFMDKYNITIPEKFDYIQKYLLVEENGIRYIKLRLKDSAHWSSILTNIFGFTIVVVKDYESCEKPIKDLYRNFMFYYKTPRNFVDELTNCKYLNYYYSEEEKREYIDSWRRRMAIPTEHYTLEQYNMYEKLSIENSHIDCIQLNHYMDEGCLCKACCIKRNEIASKLIMGQVVTERIVHSDAKNELFVKRVQRVNRINENISIQTQQANTKGGRKNFNGEMSRVVSGKK